MVGLIFDGSVLKSLLSVLLSVQFPPFLLFEGNVLWKFVRAR